MVQIVPQAQLSHTLDVKPLYDKGEENRLGWEVPSYTRWFTRFTSFTLSYNSIKIVLLLP